MAAATAALVAGLLLCFLLLVSRSVGKSDVKDTKVVNCSSETTGNISIPFYRVIQNKHSCLHVAWSHPTTISQATAANQSYPSMYIKYSHNTKQCECPLWMAESEVESEAESELYEDIGLLGEELDYSIAVIFRGIYEYPATDKKLAAKALNLTYACNEDYNMKHGYNKNDTEYNYFHFSEVEEWFFAKQNQTLIGRVGNFTRYSFRLGVPSQTGKNVLNYFPKTHFHENSTTFDFISDNYTCVSNRSRLALDMVLVHGSALKNGSIGIKKTSDDEYTPSVFSWYTYKSEPDQKSLSGEWFFQWKPISYQDDGRKSTSSQQVEVVPTGGWQECEMERIPESLVSKLYDEGHGNITRWFVVFGTSGDDSYISPTYNTWTVALGTGNIPSESFSLVVVVTIIVGFGVPGALVIISMVYVVLRRKPWQAVSRFMDRNRGYTKLS